MTSSYLVIKPVLKSAK